MKITFFYKTPPAAAPVSIVLSLTTFLHACWICQSQSPSRFNTKQSCCCVVTNRAYAALADRRAIKISPLFPIMQSHSFWGGSLSLSEGLQSTLGKQWIDPIAWYIIFPSQPCLEQLYLCNHIGSLCHY